MAGRFGLAAQFDGTGGHFAVEDFDYGSDGSYSLMFWYSVDAPDTSQYRYIFSHGTIYEPNSTHVYFSPLTTLRTNIMDQNDTGNILDMPPEEAHYDGLWHHYAVTVGVNGLRVYIDGELKGENPNQTGDPLDPEGNIILGHRSDLKDPRAYDGKLDEFRLFGEELTAPQVREWMDKNNTSAIIGFVRPEGLPSPAGGIFSRTGLRDANGRMFKDSRPLSTFRTR